jgi:hypothetical protein
VTANQAFVSVVFGCTTCPFNSGAGHCRLAGVQTHTGAGLVPEGCPLREASRVLILSAQTTIREVGAPNPAMNLWTQLVERPC